MNGKLQPLTRVVDEPGEVKVIGVTVQRGVPQTQLTYPPNRERWENAEYSIFLDKNEIQTSYLGCFWHLGIRRKDQQPANDWRDLQAIKSALVGPEYEAIELFPAESRVMDVANETHIYVLRAAVDGSPTNFPAGNFAPRQVNDLMTGQRRLTP